MKSFVSVDETEELSLPTRCRVEVVGAAGRRVGLARTVTLRGLRVQFLSNERNDLFPGQVVELNSETTPIGPIRTSARVTSVEDGTDHRGKQVVSAALSFLGLSEKQSGELKDRLEAWQPLVVILGLECMVPEDYPADFRLVKARCADDVLRHYDHEGVAVLVLGPELRALDAKELLLRTAEEFPHNNTFNIVLNPGATAELFQNLVDRGRIFYLAHGDMPHAQLRATILAAANCFREELEGGATALVVAADHADHVLDVCIQLARMVHLLDLDRLLVSAIEDLVAADRVQLLIYDREDETLWSPKTPTREERRESAAAGLLAYVARTGEGIQLESAGSDSRCDLEADDPGGSESSRFIAQAIRDTNGTVTAVLAAARNGTLPPFSSQDVQVLQLLAACAGPALGAILLQSRVQGLLLARAQSTVQTSGLFRAEALDSRHLRSEQPGGLLPSLPLWLKASHLLILLFVVAGIVYMSLARVTEKATGPVLIRARNKVAISAATAGLVRSVGVRIGDRVKQGDLLVNFENAPGDTLLERFKKELRASSAGTVSDVRVREGQQVNAGDLVVSLTDEGSGNELIALLPGANAPQIRPGMPLVLKIQGYADSHETIPIEKVAGEVVGPHEAARYIGRESTDALDVTGPIVIVSAFLPHTKFEADGRSLNYHDGMVGEAEVSIRKERMILSVIPGLKNLLRNTKTLGDGE